MSVVKQILVWILIYLPLGGSSLFAQTGDTSAVEFFVQMENNFDDDSLESYLEEFNAEMLYNYPNNLCLWKINGFPFTSNNGQTYFDIHAVIQSSKRKTQIKEVDYNIAWTLSPEMVDPNGPCFLPVDYSLATSPNIAIKISILDTGISPTIGSSSQTGYNYNITEYTGYDYVNDDLIPEDQNGHGTHIAGIIHSITHGITDPNNITFDIRKTHDSNGKAMASHVIRALHDAIDAGANIINMSFGAKDTFGMDRFFPLRVAIHTAYENDVLVVVAAGNEADNIDLSYTATIPACFPEDNIISVAAIDCQDSITFFSNYGKDGADVATLGWKVAGPDLTGGIKYVSGTSQATAIVSAQAAILGTYLSQFDPIAVKCLLQGSVAKLSQLDTFVSTGGIIQLAAAVDLQNTNNSNQPYLVTNNLADGPGSLRYGLEKYCFNSQIDFAPSSAGAIIPITERDLKIFRDLTLNGLGLTQTVIEAQGNHRALITGSNSVLTLKNLTISNTGTFGQTLLNRGKLDIENAKIK